MTQHSRVPKHRLKSTEEELARIREYLEASVPLKTRESMESMINDFRRDWGGYLPATASEVVAYITARASTQKHATISQRLAMIARWHRHQNFPDPTQDILVKQAMKGIRIKHPYLPKQARPMTLDELRVIVGALDVERSAAIQSHDYITAMRCSRDKALVLVGFWRAFRSDELSSMSVERIIYDKRKGMSIFLARSKTDKDARGMTFNVPALRELCPVQAYADWIEESGLTEGPVFRRISSTGELSKRPFNPRSINAILRGIYTKAGINPRGISTHSPRRGFAHWAADNNWNTKGLMEYVGWKDIRNATKYMPSKHGFGDLALASPSEPVILHARDGNCLPGSANRPDADGDTE
jgi:hypothetical protein